MTRPCIETWSVLRASGCELDTNGIIIRGGDHSAKVVQEHKIYFAKSTTTLNSFEFTKNTAYSSLLNEASIIMIEQRELFSCSELEGNSISSLVISVNRGIVTLIIIVKKGRKIVSPSDSASNWSTAVLEGVLMNTDIDWVSWDVNGSSLLSLISRIPNILKGIIAYSNIDGSIETDGSSIGGSLYISKNIAYNLLFAQVLILLIDF